MQLFLIFRKFVKFDENIFRMKKALSILATMIAIFILIILIIPFSQPDKYAVKREIFIQQQDTAIFQIYSNWQNFEKWNPWHDLDKNAVATFSGEMGKVGAKYAWKGNDEAGEGYMILTAVSPNQSIDYNLVFVKPWESVAKCSMSNNPKDNGTELVWVMSGDQNYMMRLFMLLQGGMDKAIGADFEKGLANIKKLAEATR